MLKINFITTPNEKFNIKMNQGLMACLENLTGIIGGPQEHTIYAQENKKIIGGIIGYSHGDVLWIDTIYTDKSRRKQGIGKMLVDQITIYAKSCGASEIQLNTYFPKAHKFFTNQGFETVFSIPKWKYGLTCYLMKRII
ncbi:MAG: GNAT family N-acetyltransferase [Legionellaceae bacterium]|nr:GNAT family N-acetyltransferase [Legionellaceae bacterium]